MRTSKALLAVPAAFALTTVFAGPAMAHGDHAATGDTSEGQAGEYSISLDELNESGAGGTAVLELTESGDLTVTIDATGHVPGQPHAMHLHGDTNLDNDFVCPTPDADEDGDGIVNVAEGVPSYGGIHISLTTEGDTSPDSGLAVDRFPVAEDDGSYTYERTIPKDELPDGTAAAIKNLHVVTHGIDVNDNGEYDFDAGPSELDPELPLEATSPASCGIIEGSNVTDVPDGGVDTGSGPLASEGTGSTMALGAVAAAGLIGLAGFGLVRRQAHQS